MLAVTHFWDSGIMNKQAIKISLLLSCSILALVLTGAARADNNGSDYDHQSVSYDSLYALPSENGPPAGAWVGHGRLERTPYGAHMRLKSKDLDPGYAYSVWWFIFNKPHNCEANPCGEADLFNPAVEASIMNGGGRVANAWGHSIFEAFLPVGYVNSNPASGNIRQFSGPGIVNVKGAEIHAVVRCHGPVDENPLIAVEQTSTLLGSCSEDNPCYDAQAIVFQRPWGSWRHQQWMGD